MLRFSIYSNKINAVSFGIYCTFLKGILRLSNNTLFKKKVSFPYSLLPANTSAKAFTYSGKSGGRRLETRCPSTTTGSSNHFAPAFSISSRIPGVLVTFFPCKIFAEISTQPAWQIWPIVFLLSSICCTNARTSGKRRSLFGAQPPGTRSASYSSGLISPNAKSDSAGTPYLPIYVSLAFSPANFPAVINGKN